MPRRSSAPSSHLTPTLAQGPMPCRCPGWEASSRGGTPGSPGCSSARGDRGHGAVWRGSPEPSCLFSSALGQLGIAAPRCCGHGEARLGLQELVFAPCLALQQGHAAPAPTGLQRCLCRAIFSHAWLPCARSRCRGHVKKELNVARGFTTGTRAQSLFAGTKCAPSGAGSNAGSQRQSWRDAPARHWVGSGTGGCSSGVRSGGDRHHGGIAGGQRRAEERGQRGGRTWGRGAAPSYLSPEQAAGLMLFWPGVKE